MSSTLQSRRRKGIDKSTYVLEPTKEPWLPRKALQYELNAVCLEIQQSNAWLSQNATGEGVQMDVKLDFIRVNRALLTMDLIAKRNHDLIPHGALPALEA
jgi:hypothetical protein